MNTIRIIHISDIHHDKNEPENQGLILNAFFEDLTSKGNEMNFDSTYCIISGDLVYAGESDKIYSNFYQNFILRLSQFVPLRNIYCIPGNHDLNREFLNSNFDEHQEIISKEFSESEFNEYVKSKDNILVRKFEPYNKFCSEKLNLENLQMSVY